MSLYGDLPPLPGSAATTTAAAGTTAAATGGSHASAGASAAPVAARMQPPTRAPLAAMPRALALASKSAGGVAAAVRSAAQTAELLAGVQRRIQAQKAAQQNLQQQAQTPAAAPASGTPFYLRSDAGASPLSGAAHASRPSGSGVARLDGGEDVDGDTDAPSNAFGLSASQLQAEYDPRFPNEYEAYVTIRDRRKREEKEKAEWEERERERGFHRDERAEHLPVAVIHSSASPPPAVAAAVAAAAAAATAAASAAEAAAAAGASSPAQSSPWQPQTGMQWQAASLPVAPAAKVDIRASSGEEAFLRRQQMSRQAPALPMPPPPHQQQAMRAAEAAHAYEPNKRPRTDTTAKPLGSAPAFVPATAAAAPSPAAPGGAPVSSRVVLLLNMVPRGDVDEELEGETAEECAKYGRVLKCTVFEAPNAPDHEAVRIFVKFETIQAAQAAAAELNGRMFGGRAVRAGFIDESKFNKGQLAP